MTVVAALLLTALAQTRVGDLRPVDGAPGGEAYRLASYVVVALRKACAGSDSLACRRVPPSLSLLRLGDCAAQLVNGENMYLQATTTAGPMNVSSHLSYASMDFDVDVRLGATALPALTLRLAGLEAFAPPCVPTAGRCHAAAPSPVCANGVAYASACEAAHACRLDVRAGVCPPTAAHGATAW